VGSTRVVSNKRRSSIGSLEVLRNQDRHELDGFCSRDRVLLHAKPTDEDTIVVVSSYEDIPTWGAQSVGWERILTRIGVDWRSTSTVI